MLDVIIIGGGLAGLTTAIHLSKTGLKVALLEKKAYPYHKVCGEYISNEVLPYWNGLGLDPFSLGAKEIKRFVFSSPTGKSVETALPLGGFSIRRYTLDFHLYEQAKAQGVTMVEKCTVAQSKFGEDSFLVENIKGEQFKSKLVIGCFGKRSVLDKNMERPFFDQRVDYLGAKQYFEMDFPDDLVGLHNFAGGYCGVSRVENNHVNVAYLSHKSVLKKYGSLKNMEQGLLCKNPYLAEVFREAKPVFAKPLVISNISFQPKELVNNHMLMSGDAAGMIPPLAGNGMAMAIHGAKILSDLVITYFQGEINRGELEKQYSGQWNHHFKNRLFWGRKIQKIMGKSHLSELALSGLQLLPGLFPKIIQQTHGEELTS